MTRPGAAPLLPLTATELTAARRDGLTNEQAEERKATALGKPHGLSPDQVRAAVHRGMDLQLAADLGKASSVDEMQAAQAAYALRQRAAEQAVFEQEVSKAKGDKP